MIGFTGGGTGGHIFPCIAVIEELRRRGHEEFVWIGQRGGREEEWALRIGVPFWGIQTGKLRRYFSLKNVADTLRVLIGFFQSLLLLLRLKPDVLFSKGGFVSVGPVIAARLLGISVVTHESDIVPGLATRIISRFASTICISFEKTRDFVSGRRVVCTGNPVRKIIKEGDREAGMSFLQCEEGLPVILVVGGSSGAARLNDVAWRMKKRFTLPFSLVHQCGEGNLRKDIEMGPRYRQFSFFDEEMGDVIAASDLIVSRAGAGALYEFGCLSKPAILVPLPKTASRGEQIENARSFEEHGAAVVIQNEDLDEELLFSTIERMISDPDSLKRMGEAAHSLCTPNAENEISDIIESLHGVKQGPRERK
jgi:UDP-N-acetylglucosamine--N-acetylmuramyl-(pentapeptide) pyrophosphoryl-undecaprenol N-acetylglucosamine transferase